MLWLYDVMYMKTRTTLVLDEKLFQLAKKKAAEKGIPLSRIVEDSLRASLLYRREPQKAYKLTWTPSDSKLIPGVDLADRDSLYEKMGEK